MPPRLRPTLLSLPLLALACGDSGSDTAGATMMTTATATASASDTSSGPDGETTQQPSGEPTTGDADTTAIATAATSTTGADDTTGGPTSADDTTGAPATTTTTSDDTTTTSDDTTGGVVCGDGVVGPGETCDDGSGVGCDSTHDGGDGTCVPADACAAGYILANGICVAELVAAHVHIMVSNTCEMTVDPEAFSVLPGQKLRLDYHNHSVDYPVDVWMHYNGGFLNLEPGGTWKEQYEHCFGPNPSEGYADISTACSEFHLPIHCL